MISTWVSVIVTLVVFVEAARNEDDIQPCAKVQASSSVVPLGSPVRASCVIRDSCPLVTGQAVLIEWRLGNRLLPSSYVTNESSRASEVVIPSFNRTRASLTCWVQASPAEVVGGVEIRAGYPPETPQNISCQTNLSTPNTMNCSWDPGQLETHLPTKYTLHTEIWNLKKNYTYALQPGDHSYTIARSGFSLLSEMKLFVRAVNELGEANSVPIILEPISAAKLDPPVIVKVETMPKKYGCLRLSWKLSRQQAWVPNPLNLEVRLKTADSSRWNIEYQIPVTQKRQTRLVDQCRLLHGTQYVIQMRVRYKHSPWSEWSSSRSGVTLETAPTGRLDSWTRVSGDHVQKQLNIHLFWKPSKQFCANGQNVSYVVLVPKLPSEKRKVCSTRENYCVFQLPMGTRKVYLSAMNAAGKSTHNEVRISLPKDPKVISDVTVDPHDDTSFLVKWKSSVSPSLNGFVVEWRPLLNADLSLTQFEITDRNQTSLYITGSFEPYKPYGISVYPRFKDGIGLPQTVNAYSRQKAPSMVPKITIKKAWETRIELIWDEIPLDQRNGIIQSYRVFYWDNRGTVNILNANLEDRRVVLKDLNGVSVYEAFMEVRTFGGSLNGSTILLKTEPFDPVAIVMIVIASGFGTSLLIIFTVMTCFSSHKRLKGHFWPAVPDPANSSIKRWTSESSQDTHLSSDSEEPNPIYLSHLSFLDIPVKLSKEDDDVWLNNAEDTSDLGESICGSPRSPGYSGSNSDSVPYATVIFSGPCSSPPPKGSHVYLRSESTQPLLETEESFSPKCYQNVGSDRMQGEQCFFGPCHDCVSTKGEDPAILWNDFPFLRALEMNYSQND